MTVNVYQERKKGDHLMRIARTIFQRPAYAKHFTVVAINRIQNTQGLDEALKVEIHVPGNPKAMDTRHISLIAFRTAGEDLWEGILENEARTCAKKMRMVGSRAAEVRSLDTV